MKNTTGEQKTKYCQNLGDLKKCLHHLKIAARKSIIWKLLMTWIHFLSAFKDFLLQRQDFADDNGSTVFLWSLHTQFEDETGAFGVTFRSDMVKK